VLMEYINKHKAGGRSTPALIIIVYFLFVGLDIYTTFLASPDLKFEGNWIISYYKLSINQIIIYAALFTFLLSSLFYISLNNIHDFIKENVKKVTSLSRLIVYQNKKMFLSFFVLGCFYSHLFCSIFLTVNNYLSYIYLFGIENGLSRIALLYLTFETKCKPFFFIFAYSLFVVVAFSFTAFKVKKIRDKYRVISA